VARTGAGSVSTSWGTIRSILTRRPARATQALAAFVVLIVAVLLALIAIVIVATGASLLVASFTGNATWTSGLFNGSFAATMVKGLLTAWYVSRPPRPKMPTGSCRRVVCRYSAVPCLWSSRVYHCAMGAVPPFALHAKQGGQGDDCEITCSHRQWIGIMSAQALDRSGSGRTNGR
jgi:uncharacterized integral membrane protein